jgi:hypothetical protein
MNTLHIARRISGGLAATAATVLLTAGCGPDKPGAAGTPSPSATPTKSESALATKSADEILSAAHAAFVGAKSVHVKGAFVDSGSTLSMDMFLGTAGGRGKIRAPIQKGKKPATISILNANGKFYVKSPQLWRQAGGAAMANLIGDRWVLVPKQDSADFKDFEEMTDIKKFGDEVLKPDETVTKGKTTVIDGTPAIGLNASDATLYVATTGAPYPLKLVPKKPKNPGEQLAFLDYNAPLNVQPPADAMDLSQLGQ